VACFFGGCVVWGIGCLCYTCLFRRVRHVFGRIFSDDVDQASQSFRYLLTSSPLSSPSFWLYMSPPASSQSNLPAFSRTAFPFFFFFLREQVKGPVADLMVQLHLDLRIGPFSTFILTLLCPLFLFFSFHHILFLVPFCLDFWYPGFVF